jgi:copper homeostasis protein
MPSSQKIVLEICAYSIDDAVSAQAAGTDRVELCANRAEAGTTPARDDIGVARKKLNVKLYVMIRPRGGDFVYSEAEFAAMKRHIEICRTVGIDGVVLGILLPNGAIDKMRCSELLKLARPMEVTFHRAFDVAADPVQALEDIIEIGCQRILTSGQANSAMEGAEAIAKLVQQARERITIISGGGIRAENLAQLMRVTGAREFHTAAYTGEQQDHNQILEMRKIADRLS